jgi:hypothetical protein
LPPIAPTDLADAVRAQLGFKEAGSVLELGGRDGDVVDLDPLRMRDPLGREGLQLLDRVVGDVLQERADEVQALVVREVGRRALVQRLAVEELPRSAASVGKINWCLSSILKYSDPPPVASAAQQTYM